MTGNHRQQENPRQQSTHSQVTSSINQGWMSGGSFIGSILSGTFLGYLADRWLGTSPWLVVIGILLGSYVGFLRLWHYSRTMVEQANER